MLGQGDSFDSPRSEPEKPRSEPGNTFEPQGIKSVRDLVHEKIADYLAATTNTKKYQCLEGLVTFCTDHIDDDVIRDGVQKKMKDRKLNFANDFLSMYRAESKTNPWAVILENEYRKLLPELRDIWFIVHRQLIKQGLLPWSYPDPRQELRDSMFRRISSKIATKIREQQEKAMTGVVPKSLPEPTSALLAPQLPKDVLPPWVDNTLPDIEKVDERAAEKKMVVDELLTVPPDIDIEMNIRPEEETLIEAADEDLEAVSDQELEDAARVWKDLLGKKRDERKDKELATLARDNG